MFLYPYCRCRPPGLYFPSRWEESFCREYGQPKRRDLRILALYEILNNITIIDVNLFDRSQQAKTKISFKEGGFRTSILIKESSFISERLPLFQMHIWEGSLYVVLRERGLLTRNTCQSTSVLVISEWQVSPPVHRHVHLGQEKEVPLTWWVVTYETGYRRKGIGQKFQFQKDVCEVMSDRSIVPHS